MSLIDYFIGWQSWSSYVSNRDLATLFERSLAKTGDRLALYLPRAEREAAVVEGLGSIENLMASGLNDLSYEVRDVSAGISGLRADFHILMGDVVWRQEIQTLALSKILRALQAPLETVSRELRARAEDAYRNGWYEEALSDFLQSAEKNYQDFAVHRSIGNIYLYHLVDLHKAAEYFQKAAKYARPRDRQQAAEAEFFTGVALGLQKEYEAALKHVREAVLLEDWFYEAHYTAAALAALLGDAKAARESVGRAIFGDARYCERFKRDRCFDKLRSEIGTLAVRTLEAQRALADALIALLESTLAQIRQQSRETELGWVAGAYEMSCGLPEIRKLRQQGDHSALLAATSRICYVLSLPPGRGVAGPDWVATTGDASSDEPLMLARGLLASWTGPRQG